MDIWRWFTVLSDWVLCILDWVIYLGPATFMDNLYQFSVITDEAQLQLAVLARNVTGFMINYAEKVQMQLQFQGFDKLINKPRVIYQGSDCKYAS